MVLATGQGVDGVVALTIGMATYNDFNGVYFTLQALRLYQDLRDTELLVVDNYGSPNTKQLVEGWVHGARYLLAKEVRGTAAPRDRVFREAQGEAVLCCDSHVLFAPGAIARLKAYYQEHPDSRDLRQRGGRCLCLPWFRWVHRFGRPAGVPYPLTVDDKFWNYLIGHMELGLDL